MKLTEQQKQEKRQRGSLQHLINKMMSAFSFKTIKTWRDVYVTSGIDNATIASTYSNADIPVTFPELKKYCDGLKAQLESSIVTRNITKVGAVEPVKEPEVKATVPTATTISSTPTVTAKSEDDYGLVHSPNEKAYLYWFQKKAVAEMLLGFGIA